MTLREQTLPWDAAEHLETEADMVAYLEAALELGDPAVVGRPGRYRQSQGHEPDCAGNGLGQGKFVQGPLF